MTDFTQSISNSINVFGLEPTNKWGAFDWGENWGIGDTDMVKVVTKAITDGISLVDAISEKQFTHPINFGSVSLSADMDSETLQTGEWYHKFVANTTEGEERDFATWAEVADASTTYTSASAGSTTWTEV